MKADSKVISIVCVVCMVHSSNAAAGVFGLYTSVLVAPLRKIVPNLSGLFGSRTDLSPYDRVAGHPVFSVTTPWGSPYLCMEKPYELDESIPTVSTSKNKLDQIASFDDRDSYRSVALFFLDPDDALGVHGEMKQMEGMKTADLRITSFSLSKALRQASNLGNGLLTGLPPEANDGTLRYSDGATLRYKIVPPKRQLYYASRCKGRERVGLQSDNPSDDARAAVMGSAAINGLNVNRRNNLERKSLKTSKDVMTDEKLENLHMAGYTGIPVFYEPQLAKPASVFKRIVSGAQHELPFFFNYEDLQEAWKHMRSKQRFKSRVPEQPPTVEVFNLWDLLTSIDREMLSEKQMRDKDPLQVVLHPLRKRFSKIPTSLNHISFIPSSSAVQYKESISSRGNSKCRLRPMR